MADVVNAIEMFRVASASPDGATQASPTHWREQSVSREDVTHMSQLYHSVSPQTAEQANALEQTPQTARPVEHPAAPGNALTADVLGRKQLFAALDALRNTPAERMPVVAAQLMMQCYEYQFNVTAVTQAAKNFEDSVQTMTTRT